MPNPEPGAVVIGLDSITGLQTARRLASRGVPVTGIAASSAHPCCRTNVCERIVIARTAGEDLVACLKALASTFETPAVLVPCTDLSVLAISRHRAELAGLYHFVMPEAAAIELLLDKARFQDYAAAAGLPIARSIVLSNRSDAERAASDLRFPCVLKPAVKTPGWLSQTKAKVFRVDDGASLLRRYDECCSWTDQLIAQEWIDGSDGAHVTCNAYFDREGRPYITFVSQKIRQWPLEGGVACLSQECRNDEVLHETVRLFQGVGHRGPAYLEMKLDRRTGRYVIIEPNVGRPTGRSAAADDAGVDLLYAQYCDALGRPLPPAHPQRYGGAKWIYLRQDLQSAVRRWRRGDLTLADWVRSLRGVRRDAVFAWNDPRPFFADLATLWRKARSQRAGVPAPAPAAARTPADFDVHGVVGVRLVDATPRDAAVVARQLGPFQRPLDREPDIVVRFVDDLPVEGLQWVEFGRTGFTSTGFYIVQSGKRPAKVTLRFEDVGHRLEIVCQRGLRAVPHLMALVTMTALGRGYVPVHGSAFVSRGIGVLVVGWAKGGKTESLLAFADEGAEYIGDEWILLTPDGGLLGIPEHIRLQDWHLAQLPAVRGRVPARTRLFFRSVRALEALHRAASRGPLSALWPGGAIGEALPALRRQLNVQLDPSDVFARSGSFASRFDTLCLMVSHDRPAITVEPADAAEIADRMAASVAFERAPILSAWLAYQFAFPDRRNYFLERIETLQREGLSRLLAGREAYVVRHPYPCRLRDLYDAMAPICHPQDRPARKRATVTPFVGRPVTVEERHS